MPVFCLRAPGRARGVRAVCCYMLYLSPGGAGQTESLKPEVADEIHEVGNRRIGNRTYGGCGRTAGMTLFPACLI